MLISIVIVVTCFSFAVVTANALGGTTGSCNWSLNTSTGELKITGSGPMGEFDWVGDQPWYSNYSKIKTVTIGKGVTEITSHSFGSCPNLKKVTIPSSVTDIGCFCFEDSEKLSTISITPNKNLYTCGVPFENTAFFNNSSNWSGKALYLKSHLLSVKSYATGTLKVRDGTTSIDSYAFMDCKVSKVILPHGIKDFYGFLRCSNLKEVIFTNSIKKIWNYAFSDTSSLEKITFRGDISQFSKINVGRFNGYYDDAYYVMSPVSLKLKKSSAKLKVKKTTTIKATVKHSDYGTKYSSNNKKIATVNSKGKVTAKKKGTTKIKVTNCNVTKYFTVKVVKK